MTNDNIEQFLNLFYDSEYAFTKNSLICIHSNTETANSLVEISSKKNSLWEIITILV